MIRSSTNGLFTYTRTLFEEPTDFVVYDISNTFYVAALSRTLKIYDVRTFNLIFSGPSFAKKPSAIQYYDRHFYVAIDNFVHVVGRGETKDVYAIYGGDEYTMHRLNQNEWHKATDTAFAIRQMLTLGSLVFILLSTNVVLVTENFEVLDCVGYESAGDEIRYVMHPSTYINKVLIVYSSRIEIYNFVTKKTIHVFEIGGVDFAVQTPLIDVVALVNSTGVVFFNLRHGKELFSIKVPAITHISFRTDGEPYCICSNENSYIFDMKRGKCVKELAGIRWACFLPDQKDFISVGRNLELYTLEGYNSVLVHRRMLTYRAESMSILDKKRLVLMNSESVVGVSLYQHNHVFSFSCKGLANLWTLKTGNGVLAASDSRLFVMDFEHKNGKAINESSAFEFEHLGFEHPFYVYGNRELRITNVESKHIMARVSTLRRKGSETAGCQNEGLSIAALKIVGLEIMNMKVYLATSDKVFVLDFEGCVVAEADIGEIKKMKKHTSYVSVQTNADIVLMDAETLKVVRVFPHVASDYDLNSDQTWLGVINKDMLLVDVSSGKVVECLTFHSDPVTLAFSWNHDCLFVLFGDGSVGEYYNNSLVNEYLVQPSFAMKQCTGAADPENLIEAFERDFFKAQSLITGMEERDLDRNHLANFIEFYNKKWVEVEEMCLETIGIIEFYKKVRAYDSL